MSYRGDDMDLRLPQSRAVSARERYEPERASHANGVHVPGSNGTRYHPPASGRTRSSTLYVDDTVLAICNAAHEIAQAYHAPEVLLQHVVHGMTRVNLSIQYLRERYNIDHVTLRRDVLALISETSARGPGSADLPLTSSEFKAALRLAGDAAGQREGGAIEVQDLVRVLMHYDIDHPGVAVLTRHADTDGNRAPTAATHTIEVEPLYRQQPPRAARPEPAEERPQPVAPAPRPEPTPEPARIIERVRERDDSRIVDRLVALEDQVRRQMSDLDDERRQIKGLIGDLQRDIGSHRKETSGLRDTVAHQLRDLRELAEREPVPARDDGALTASINERIRRFEQSVDGRLVGITDGWTSLQDQVRKVEAALDGQHADMRKAVGALETGIAERTASSQRAYFAETVAQPLLNRMEHLEASLAERLEAMPAPMLISEGGEGLGTDHIERFEAALEKQRVDMNRSMHERERNWTAANERLNRMEHILQNQAEVVERATVDRQRLMSGVSERLARLEQAAASNGDHGQTAQILAQTNERMANLERAVGAMGAVGSVAIDDDGRFTDLQNTVVRMGGMQNSMAESMEQWRLDLTRDVGSLGKRIDGLEASVRQPVDMLHQIQAELNQMRREQHQSVHDVAHEGATTVTRTTTTRNQGVHHQGHHQDHRQPQQQARAYDEDAGLWAQFSNWLFGPR